MSGPLLTIKFAGPQGVATRYFYCVPRIGDHVGLTADDQDENGDEPPSIVAGTVDSVLWLDNYIHVNVTMGNDLDARARKERNLD